MSAKKKAVRPASNAAPEQKPVVITLTIFPLKHRKRPLLISAAHAGEMPLVHSSTFDQLHPALNQVWLELMKRKPQTVKVGSGPKRQDGKKKDNTEGADANGVAELEEQITATEKDLLSSEYATPGSPNYVAPPEELPVIEGDTLAPQDVDDNLQVEIMQE